MDTEGTNMENSIRQLNLREMTQAQNTLTTQPETQSKIYMLTRRETAEHKYADEREVPTQTVETSPKRAKKQRKERASSLWRDRWKSKIKYKY
jgi:hypothetical protein